MQNEAATLLLRHIQIEMKTIKEEKLCEYRNDARRAVRKILTKHQARYR